MMAIIERKDDTINELNIEVYQLRSQLEIMTIENVDLFSSLESLKVQMCQRIS